MDMLRQYVMSLTAAAMLCGTVLALSGETHVKNQVRIVTGMLLAICVLAPLTRIDVSEVDILTDSFIYEADEAAAQGLEISRRAQARIIKEKTEAYILDKAADMDAEISAQITLSEDNQPVPVAVRIIGNAVPHVRRQLQIMLQQELGISKENQQWIAEP